MSNGPIRTLLVTSDLHWQAQLYFYLARNDFEVVGAVGDAASALTLFRVVCPELVIIEAQLPDAEGLPLGQLIQTMHPTVKVVLVAADDASCPPTAIQNNVAGCINRDYPLHEWASLLTYIHSGGAVFSQSIIEEALVGAWLAKSEMPAVVVGPLMIDVIRRQVTLSGQRVNLTPREFALLACLACNVGRVVTFDQLLDEAWGYDSEMGTSVQVRMYITRLRRKLVDDPAAPDLIVSERGVGYRLRNQAQWQQKAKRNGSPNLSSLRLSQLGSGVIVSLQSLPTPAVKIKKPKDSLNHFIEHLHDSGERIWQQAHLSLVEEFWPALARALHKVESETITRSRELIDAVHEMTGLFLDDLVVGSAQLL